MLDKEKLIIDMLAGGQQTAREIMRTNTQGTNVQRRGFLVAQYRARLFINDQTSKSWVAMPGLRGTGKTTILVQLYNSSIFKDCLKLFVSFDRIKTIGATTQEFIDACEKFIGRKFELMDQPIAIFIDEVQYLEDWAVGLKTVLDRSNRIFIFCTGSSALSLQTNADVARRIDFIKIHPLCFTEYIMIKQAHSKLPLTMPIRDLNKKLLNAIFYSESAEGCYLALSRLSDQVNAYWQDTHMTRSELFGEYLTNGTLPFTLLLPDKPSIWSRINRILSESLDRDVSALGKFDASTVAAVNQLLFLLASSTEISMNKLASTLQLNNRTIAQILDSLEKTEIITAIPPKGAHNGRVKKPAKYLFTSPAMRTALCNFGGIINPNNNSTLKGRLLEDLVGLYLKRLFLDDNLTRAIVEYDTLKGGADFIVSADGKRTSSVVIEVGANKKTARQVLKTLNDLSGKYGLIITNGSLGFDKNVNVARIPLEYFLLL